MSRKKRLGGGLDTLFGQDSMDRFKLNISETGELLADVDVNLISAATAQSRTDFNEDKIKALADSIAELGLLQPITVKRDGGSFELIAGERRLRAVKSLGHTKIKAIVKDADEKTVAQLTLLENMQREDLNPIEEANGYNYLMTEFNMTQEGVGLVAGKSRAYISNIVRLLNLKKAEQKALIDQKISVGHAKVLLSIKDSRIRKSAFNDIIKNNLTVRELENLIAKPATERKSPQSDPEKDPEVRRLENDLTEVMGTKVFLKGGLNKGSIVVEYYSEEELERLTEMMLHVEQ